MFFVCVLCCKLCLVFFYLRLFTTQTFRISAFVVAMLCLGSFIGGLVPFAIQCQPTSMSLRPGIPDTCLSMLHLFLGINLSNFLTNLLVLLLPMPFVWALKLSFKPRLLLTLVFVMGGFACVVSLIRVILQDEWLQNLYSVYLESLECATANLGHSNGRRLQSIHRHRARDISFRSMPTGLTPPRALRHSTCQNNYEEDLPC